MLSPVASFKSHNIIFGFVENTIYPESSLWGTKDVSEAEIKYELENINKEHFIYQEIVLPLFILNPLVPLAISSGGMSLSLVTQEQCIWALDQANISKLLSKEI